MLFFYICLFVLGFASPLEENEKLRKSNQALTQALKELTIEARGEKAVAGEGSCSLDSQYQAFESVFGTMCNQNRESVCIQVGICVWTPAASSGGSCSGVFEACAEADKDLCTGPFASVCEWTEGEAKEAEVGSPAQCYESCRRAGGKYSECNNDCYGAEKAVAGEGSCALDSQYQAFESVFGTMCNQNRESVCIQVGICVWTPAASSGGSCSGIFEACAEADKDLCTGPFASVCEWTEGEAKEESVGFSGKYKCLARNDCISECQDGDSSKTWYACMKECPKSLCDKDAASESMDPEDEEDDDSEEEAVGLTCSIAGFEGTVTTDSWCDKRDGVWMHKCSGCKHGYYWYWWHTYCCTPGKSGCTCAYN